MMSTMISLRAIAIAAFASMLTLTGAMAQEAEVASSDYTDISSYLVTPSGGAPDAAPDAMARPQPIGSGYNSASVSQTGQGNVTSVIQLGYANTTSQTQIGDNNVSALTLTGNANTVSTQQVGNSNSYSLNLTGSNNTISQSQVGNGLSYSLSTTMSGKSISVQQAGSR